MSACIYMQMPPPGSPKGDIVCTSAPRHGVQHLPPPRLISELGQPPELTVAGCYFGIHACLGLERGRGASNSATTSVEWGQRSGDRDTGKEQNRKEAEEANWQGQTIGYGRLQQTGCETRRRQRLPRGLGNRTLV